jgi:iron uptake system component EfeO
MPASLTMRRLLAAGATAAVLLAACSEDDGADVRDISEGESGSASGSGTGSASGSASASASGSGSASASGSGSASGIDVSGAESSTDNAAVAAALEEYRIYVTAQAEASQEATKEFTDAVRAGDVEAAKAAYAPSRQGWERIEPIAGLIEDIDVAVDARVDDFSGPDDPTWTGWHKLEYLLFDQNTTEGGAEIADQLDADLQRLVDTLPTLEIPPVAMAVGAQELIEEVSEGKITGEEDRYSGTDLWDFAANVEGSEAAFELLEPALEEVDPALVEEIDAAFAEVEELLEPYRDGDGWQPYSELTEDDRTEMSAALGELAEALSQVAGALGLS